MFAAFSIHISEIVQPYISRFSLTGHTKKTPQRHKSNQLKPLWSFQDPRKKTLPTGKNCRCHVHFSSTSHTNQPKVALQKKNGYFPMFSRHWISTKFPGLTSMISCHPVIQSSTENPGLINNHHRTFGLSRMRFVMVFMCFLLVAGFQHKMPETCKIYPYHYSNIHITCLCLLDDSESWRMINGTLLFPAYHIQ